MVWVGFGLMAAGLLLPGLAVLFLFVYFVGIVAMLIVLIWYAIVFVIGLCGIMVDLLFGCVSCCFDGWGLFIGCWFCCCRFWVLYFMVAYFGSGVVIWPFRPLRFVLRLRCFTVGGVDMVWRFGGGLGLGCVVLAVCLLAILWLSFRGVGLGVCWFAWCGLPVGTCLVILVGFGCVRWFGGCGVDASALYWF